MVGNLLHNCCEPVAEVLEPINSDDQNRRPGATREEIAGEELAPGTIHGFPVANLS
jgi:hypothetical protein